MPIVKISFWVRETCIMYIYIVSLDVGPYISFTFLYFTTLPVMYFIILYTFLFMSLLNKHKTDYNRRFIVILTHICQKAFPAPSLSVSNTSTPIYHKRRV